MMGHSKHSIPLRIPFRILSCKAFRWNTSPIDADGNVYGYVRIGTQLWMTENLKTTKYSDGTAIPNLSINDDWINDETGAYCWYNNDITNKPLYGGLYNNYAVVNEHGLAPEGWRIPTEEDVAILLEYIGGISVVAKFKSIGTTYWNTPNTSAENARSFDLRGGGNRMGFNGAFVNLKDAGAFWYEGVKIVQALHNSATGYSGAANASIGYSVRCLKY